MSNQCFNHYAGVCSLEKRTTKRSWSWLMSMITEGCCFSNKYAKTGYIFKTLFTDIFIFCNSLLHETTLAVRKSNVLRFLFEFRFRGVTVFNPQQINIKYCRKKKQLTRKPFPVIVNRTGTVQNACICRSKRRTMQCNTPSPLCTRLSTSS